jgi:hypothetical protein
MQVLGLNPFTVKDNILQSMVFRFPEAEGTVPGSG